MKEIFGAIICLAFFIGVVLTITLETPQMHKEVLRRIHRRKCVGSAIVAVCIAAMFAIQDAGFPSDVGAAILVVCTCIILNWAIYLRVCENAREYRGN